MVNEATTYAQRQSIDTKDSSWHASAYRKNEEIGVANLLSQEIKQFLETEPGKSMEAAIWLADRGIVAFGGDTWTSEVYTNPTTNEEFPIN